VREPVEAPLVAQPVAPPTVAAWLRDRRPAVLELEVQPARPEAYPVQPQLRGRVAPEQALGGPLPVRPPEARRAVEVGREQQKVGLVSLPVLARQARRVPVAGRLRERRPAPRRGVPGKLPPGVEVAPGPKGPPSRAERAAAARRRAPRGARGGKFSCPRAQCPRRGYSQVAALFP
jgi:hypothetical protein